MVPFIFQRLSLEILINGAFSDDVPLEIDPPQGPGAGRFGYKTYTMPLGNLIQSLLLEILCMFSDDSQLFKSLSSSLVASLFTTRCEVEHCIDTFPRWKLENHLKLDENKTELIIIGKKPHLRKWHTIV